jgi:PAS domain S-box-containing protein
MSDKPTYQALKEERDILQSKNEKLNFLIENSVDVIYELDRSLKFIYVSPSVYNNIGYTPEEWIGHRISEFTTWKEFAKMAREALYAIKNYKTFEQTTFETVFIHKNGNPIHFEIIGKVMFNSKGLPVGVMGGTRNITNRKENERAVKESEEKFRNLVNHSPDIIYQYSNTRGGLFWSNSVKEILGYNPKEIITDPFLWNRSIHPDDKETVQNAIEDNEKGKDYNIEYRIQSKKGNWVWLHDYFMHKTQLDDEIIIEGHSTDITLRKEAEHALIESEEKYRTLVDSLNEGVYMLDSQGVITFANRALAHIYGVEHPDEIIGKNFTSFLPPELRDKLFEQFRSALASGVDVKVISTEIIRRDGTSRFVEIKPQLILKDGNPRGDRTCLMQDVTERKQAEYALLENQKRFEKSQALGHVGNWDYNFKSDEFWVSNESKRIYGFNLDSNNFSAEQIERCIPDRERVHQALIDLIERDKEYDLEYEIIPADNTPHKIIHSVAELERDKLNNPLRVRGVILDITKQKKVEQTLKTSQEKLTEAQAIAHLGHWELDIIDNKLTWSDEIFKMFEFTPQTFKPSYETFLKITHPDDRQGVDTAYTNSVQNKTKYKIEHRLLLKSGTIKYVQEKWKTQFNENGEAIRSLGTVLDITELKKTEQLLKESNASKDRFFSIIAHDLRSPFNNILGLTELLIEDTNDFQIADYKKYVGLINSSAKNTLVLLDNLLNWAKLQTDRISFNPEKLVFSSICQEVFKISQTSAKNKNIILDYSETEEIIVLADRNMIKTILRNLISNAIKFTNRNGKIDVSALQNAKFIEIAVSDNGVGMDEETQNKLFRLESNESRLGTANEKGTGLGLVLCKDFVEKHGGEIWVESKLGKGSVFEFKLPKNKLNERE